MTVNRFLRKALIASAVFCGMILFNHYVLEPRHLSHNLIIYDVDRDSIFRLTNIGVHKGPDRIDLLVEGTLDGKAQIYQLDGSDKKDLHEIGPGAVYLRMGGPWHSNSYVLKYDPVQVSTGQLKIKYNFKD